MHPHAVGVPPDLLHSSLRVFRTQDAAAVYAHPRPQLARLTAAGVIHRLAGGVYAVVPPEFTGLPWHPDLEAAAGGIAAALFGPDNAVLMGLSAARLHGAVPRALAVAIVAVPRQHRPITLLDRAARVLFVARDIHRLDAELTQTELGPLLITGTEQTALDLAHRPTLGDAEDQARESAAALFQNCDAAILDSLAHAQRLVTAARRLRAWAT